MNTISFDFDNTLFNEEEEFFFPETLLILKHHIDIGDRVIITTSRIQKWADEAKVLLLRIRLDLDVFSAPDKIGDGGLTKSDVLVRENAIIHFDDLPDVDELVWAKENNIRIVLPPHLRKEKDDD